MSIINLTINPATPEQAAAGVVDLPAGPLTAALAKALTFGRLPDYAELVHRAEAIASIAEKACTAAGCSTAMIGGEPGLMSHVEAALHHAGIVPVYAFHSRYLSGTGADFLGFIWCEPPP